MMTNCGHLINVVVSFHAITQHESGWGAQSLSKILQIGDVPATLTPVSEIRTRDRLALIESNITHKLTVYVAELPQLPTGVKVKVTQRKNPFTKAFEDVNEESVAAHEYVSFVVKTRMETTVGSVCVELGLVPDGEGQ